MRARTTPRAQRRKSNDGSSTSHTSGTRRESALLKARLTAVDRGQLTVDNSYLASLERSLAELVYDSWQGTITRMTFGTINIEKSLVARRDTAESKTDDRGQLTVGS